MFPADPVPLSTDKNLSAQEIEFLRSHTAGLALDPRRCVLESKQEWGA
jgi:hypothetical protein